MSDRDISTQRVGMSRDPFGVAPESVTAMQQELRRLRGIEARAQEVEATSMNRGAYRAACYILGGGVEETNPAEDIPPHFKPTDKTPCWCGNVWPGHCQTCGAVLVPPDANSCRACGRSDADE